MAINEEIADRISKLIATRELMGMHSNTRLTEAMNTIRILPYNLSDFYHQHNSLPPELLKKVSPASIVCLVEQAIYDKDIAEDYERRRRAHLEPTYRRDQKMAELEREGLPDESDDW